MGIRTSRRRFLYVLAALSSMAVVMGSSAEAPLVVESPVNRARDVVVAGGIDGRVYAINAWTGDMLWMFDSGGPMVDSSECGGVHTAAATEPHWAASTTASRTASTTASTAADHDRADDKPLTTTASSASTAVSATVLSQMIPSYDGRLYHIDGANVRELDMTMVDIINANGPVRLAHASPSPNDKDSENPLSDLLLFGEKSTTLFPLDATQGLLQPFGSPQKIAPTLLFGRAEFKTRAVHARNLSTARCLTISEYFLEFAGQSQCTKDEDSVGKSPTILVLPKDPDASNPDEEESTIAAYDPFTNKQLWERHIPNFDVIAVYGVATHRGASFFKWSIEGPSSTQPKKDLVMSQRASSQEAVGKQTTARQLIGAESNPDVNNESVGNKHLVKTVPRDILTMESEFRLRLLDGNYYLESHDDDADVMGGPTASADSSEGFTVKRKRRIFWEPMESGGKKGVFITYYHVGTMTIGAMIGCIILAWGFYVKGLTASGNGIHAMGRHEFLAPTGHVHQLTIEQPGRETITISSSITRALLLEAAVASGFVPQNVPLIENGEHTFAGSNSTTSASPAQVQLDPATEAMLLEKFTKMVAMEAAAALADTTRFSDSNIIQLEEDPDVSSSSASARTSSTVTVVASSTSSSSHRHRLSLQADDSSERVVTAFEGASSTTTTTMTRSNLTHDNDGRIVPVIEELDSTTFEEDSFTLETGMFDAVATSTVDDTTSSATLRNKAGGLWDSDTTGSCESSKAGSSSSSSSSSSSDSSNSSNISNGEEDEVSETSISQAREDVETRESAVSSSGDGTTTLPRRASNASSSSSSSASASASAAVTEAEVLFPFVCQSRFANEFVELSALGKGGFGQVMLAENRLDGRKYAIKRVGLHLKHQTSKTLQKFLREVKILALLDHPHIVRYYQAWLEKVEEGTLISTAPFSSDGGSEGTIGTAPPRNYSMSNLLAPISEMEFSNHQRSVASFYSSGSLGDDDGGFDWERDPDEDEQDVHAWREEDLAPTGKKGKTSAKLPSLIEPNVPPKANGRALRGVEENDDSSCYSIDRCDHWLYIQMQYCAGRNLGDYLALPTRTMELPKLLKIFTQIASAIAHVHSCGLIHRDLKPANIFVADTDGDSIKLGDFGLSRYAANVNLATTTTEEQSTTTATAASLFLNGGHASVSKWSMSMSNMSESQDITAGVGTYLYASPEQVAGKKYNATTDMYSLGMILFELCHERFATTMERYVTLRNARERIFPGEFVWRRKCPEIMDMLERLLHPDAMSRPDAAEVVQWSQELYEQSLASQYHNSSGMRSPIHHSRSFQGTLPTLGLEHSEDTTAFSLQVEARMDSGSEESGSGSGSSGERRLPNHNLLKELCDVIADVSGGRMEIKKCGLHLQDGGAQILDFVLDPHWTKDEENDDARVKEELINVIQALPGVHTVRVGR